MSKFKSVGGGSAYRSSTGKLRVLSRENDYLFRVEVWLLNSAVNRNNWQYLNLEAHRELFVDTPILVAYTQGGNKIGDGHNFRTKRDANGKEYALFTDATAERIVGWFKNDGDIRIEEKDGVKWLVGVGNIWTYYAAELTAMLVEQGANGMEVSIETLIKDMYMEGDTEVFTSYQILGTTILGKDVTPAVAGACIRRLSLSSDLEKFKLRVAAEQQKTANNEEKKKEKKHMAFNKALLSKMQEQFEGYTIVGHDDEGLHFALLSKADGCLYGYARNAEDGDEIVKNRIAPVVLSAAAKFDSGDEVSVDMLAALEESEKRLQEAEAKAEEAEKRAKKAEEEKDAMGKKENARRRASILSAINAEIEAYNEEADEKLDDKACEDIIADANADKYTDCENEKGEFCGAEVACSAVKSRIWDHEKAVRAKRNAKKVSWLDGIRTNSKEEQSGIPGLLSRINK